MGHLRELFTAAVVAPGLRGDAYLPAGDAGAPAAFYDPDQARDAHGRWGGTASAEMTRLAAGWTHDLTEGQSGALRLYTGPLYRDLNTALRAHPTDPEPVERAHRRYAEQIDAAIRKFPKHPPQTSYRGMTVKDDAKWERLRAGFEAAHATGEPLALHGFTSASLEPKIAALFAGADGTGRAVLEIRSPRGAYLGNQAAGSEKEVLHNHGERFKVVAVEDREYKDVFNQTFTRPTYVLEAVPEPPPPLFGGQTVDPPRVRKAAGFSEWNPDLHPRGDHGQFGPGGTAGAPAPSPAREVLTQANRPDAASDAAFIDRGRAWAGRLDDKERGAITAYTGNYYRGINKSLRENPDPTSPAHSEKTRMWVRRISRALDKFTPFPTPVASYRGIKTTAKSKLVKIEAAFKAALATGEPVTMTGFSSASLDPAIAADWTPAERGVVLEMKSRRGVYLGRMSKLPNELEVLHPHRSQFKVTGVRTVDYPIRNGTRTLTTYTLEEVEPVRPAPAAAAPHPAAKFYDDGQERDEHGRWAKGGASAPDLVTDPHTGETRRRVVGLEDRAAMDGLALARQVLPAKPRTDAQIAKVEAFYAASRKVVDGWLAESGGHLPPAARALYAKSLKRCFDYMTPKAVQTVFRNLGSSNPTFYPNIDAVTAEVNTRQRSGDGAKSVAGFWSWNRTDAGGLGSLHLNGGYETPGGAPDMDTLHIHAHELGHAIDGHYGYSGSIPWTAAWMDEIDTDPSPLSAYARTDPHEGFAEFHRLMVVEPKYARTSFPQCYAFWKERGLA